MRSTDHPGTSKLFYSKLPAAWPYAAIFLLALALRLIYLAEIADTPLTKVLLGDAESYDAWAREILQSGWLGERTFYQAPLYPYFLALVYALGGRDLLLVRLVQAVVGALSCTLLARAGSSFFDRRIGWLAGTLLAVYPAALFFDILIQKAVLGMFFMCALLCLMGEAAREEHGKLRPWVWLAAGLTLACFALTRENALVLVPIVVAWAVMQFRTLGGRPIAVRLALLAGGLALVFAPVTLRNYLVGNEFVLTTSQMGPNFYIGNSREATGFYRPLVWDHSDWKYERTDALELAERDLGRKLTPNEVSRYWRDKAFAEIRQDPWRWLRLMGRKWLLTVNSVETSDSESIYAHERVSHLLGTLGGPLRFGVFFPLAALGVGLTWRSRRHLWGLYAVWLGFAASVALFFIFDRYRHPMTAVMLMFAAAGLTELYRRVKSGSLLSAAPGICLGLLMAVPSNWPLVSRTEMEAPTYFNLGYELEQRGDLSRARGYYERSLQMDGSNTLAHNNLGIVAMKQDRPDEALEHFRAAVAAKPDNLDARVNLGIVLWELGRKAEAVGEYQRVLAAEPGYNNSLYYNIACYHALAGRAEEGLKWLRLALERGYDRWDLVHTDPDLESVRQLPGYQAAIDRFRGGSN